MAQDPYDDIFAPLSRPVLNSELPEETYGVYRPVTTYDEQDPVFDYPWYGSRGGGEASDVEEVLHPFKIVVVDDEYTIAPGTVNSLLPSNIFSTFSVPSAGTHYVILQITASTSGINSVSISSTTSAPSTTPVANGTVPGSFDIILGVFNDGLPYQVMYRNASCTPTIAFTVEKTPPLSLGEYPLINYYTWRIDGY